MVGDEADANMNTTEYRSEFVISLSEGAIAFEIIAEYLVVRS